MPIEIISSRRRPAMERRTAAIAGIHLAVFLFGTAAVLAKLTSLAASDIVLGRTLFAWVTLLVVVPWMGKHPWHLPRRKLACMLPLGGLLAFHWFAFFQSVITASVAVGLITFSSFPLFTTIIEPYFFIIRRRRRDLVYACCILAGVALVIPEYDLSNRVTLGASWGLGSGLAFAFLQILNRRYVQDISAIELLLGQNLVAFASLLLIFSSPVLSQITLAEWLLLVVLGIVCTALAHTLFVRGLESVSAQTASVITGLEPVYGIALAILVLGEVPGQRTVLGGAIVLGTVICATRDSNRRPTPASTGVA